MTDDDDDDQDKDEDEDVDVNVVEKSQDTRESKAGTWHATSWAVSDSQLGRLAKGANGLSQVLRLMLLGLSTSLSLSRRIVRSEEEPDDSQPHTGQTTT